VAISTRRAFERPADDEAFLRFFTMEGFFGEGFDVVVGMLEHAEADQPRRNVVVAWGQ
jgi:hypothetical protein